MQPGPPVPLTTRLFETTYHLPLIPILIEFLQDVHFVNIDTASHPFEENPLLYINKSFPPYLPVRVNYMANPFDNSTISPFRTKIV